MKDHCKVTSDQGKRKRGEENESQSGSLVPIDLRQMHFDTKRGLCVTMVKLCGENWSIIPLVYFRYLH